MGYQWRAVCTGTNVNTCGLVLGWDKVNSLRNMTKLRIMKAELWIINNVKDTVKVLTLLISFCSQEVHNLKGD